MPNDKTTLLVTGFGPFPGAPVNPTAALIARLARLQRAALGDVTIVTHVFNTSYAAVDRDLPALLARHKPNALLMFGLHGRARTLRIELRGRNALALLPDAAHSGLRRSKIAPGAPPALALPLPAPQLLSAARAAKVAAVPSGDAGRYLCNYLIWRAAEAAKTGRPRLAAFVHVPPVRRKPRPFRAGRPRLSAEALARAGTALLLAMAAAARR